MARIGNRKDAKFIHEWHHNDRMNTNVEAPEGWKRLGTGAYRFAYLHEATDVVYKVERYAGEDDGYGSRSEIRNARKLWKESAGDGFIGSYLRIPKTSGFSFGDYLVVAMEAIRGSIGHEAKDACAEGRHELFRIGKFTDMHWFNYFIDEAGYCVPVDMASPRNRSRHDADLRVLQETPYYDSERAARRARRGW